MIYITGDIHGNPRRFDRYSFPERSEMTKNDYVIICGDFGLVWNMKEESQEEKYWLNCLDDLPFTTLFVDGNHENYDRLNAYAVEKWNGGRVHKIRPSVIHLMRGQVFTIDGKKIFTFGGASSHDISDGIIEMDDEGEWSKIAKEWYMLGKIYRIKGLSWWEQELPSQEEMDEGIRNLEVNGNKVDFVVTHSPAASVVALLGQGLYKQDVLTKYLEEIRANTEYTKWFCGHMHVNMNVNEKDIIIYEQIIRIN